MMRVKALGALATMTLLLAACEEDFHTEVGPVGRDAFANYVAIGTSVSMGVRNGYNAVTAETQIGSWPSLLAHQANQSLSLPLFKSPGCFVPLAAPLSFGISQNSVSAAPHTPSTVCAGLIEGIEPPQQSVAISGHTIAQAVYQTPESSLVACPPVPQPTTAICGEGYRQIVDTMILPPQRSQIGAMVMQDPTLVSVELGANDVLGALSGVMVPGFTVTWDTTYARLFDIVADSVEKTGARALLMGLPVDVEKLPSLYLGSEIWADRANFAKYYVSVGADCSVPPAANNHVFYLRVLSAIQSGRAAAAAGQPPAALNCTDAGGATPDATLTPADLAFVKSMIAGYNSKLQAVASANGWAYATIGAPYEQTKPAFRIDSLLTSSRPFGTYVSLDGVHPSAVGQKLIANSAIAAVNSTYGFEIPLIP